MTRCIIIFFFVLLSIPSYGQKVSDSLLKKSYDELLELYINEGGKKALPYAEAYLKKGKKEKNDFEILTGYHLYSDICVKEKRLLYLDSIIVKTQDNPNNTYPASAYIDKGDFFFEKRNFKDALDNFLAAKEYAVRSKNKHLIFNSNFCIGKIRDRTRDTLRALMIHRENYFFAKKNESKLPINLILNATYALANAYNNVHKLDSAKYYNIEGIKIAIQSGNKNKYHLLLLNEGATLFYQGNYKSAIDSLQKTSLYFKKVNDKHNLSESLYFLAKSNLKSDKIEDAIYNFKRIDTIFNQTKDVLPKMRDSYEFLVLYYKNEGNLEEQLYYINQLIKLDRILNSNELYLSSTLIKNYDIPKLVAEKEEIISALERNKTINQYVIYFILFVLSVAIFIIYWQYLNKKKYKQRFEEIVNKNVQLTKPIEIKDTFEYKNLSDEITSSILIKLEEFEDNRLYLKSKINIQSLAKQFNTNSNYLSKTINQYKSKNFTRYINDLRIEYITEELKRNRVYRKYTIKALAEEIGFNSSDGFSRAFLKKNGIKPSFFISELKKINN